MIRIFDLIRLSLLTSPPRCHCGAVLCTDAQRSRQTRSPERVLVPFQRLVDQCQRICRPLIQSACFCKSQKCSKAGYTLIELSISIMIIGLLAAAFVTGLGARQEAERQATTRANMELLHTAILGFVRENGALPCPASGTVTAASASYGVENCALANLTGVPPVRDLNLPDEMMLDGWRRRFTYRIATGLGTNGDFTNTSNTGTIIIRNLQDENLTDATWAAAYVLISHGSNGGGTYLASGSVMAANAAPEDENADHATDAIYYSDKPSSGFDDIVEFRTKAQLAPSLFMRKASPIRFTQAACDAATAIASGAVNLDAGASTYGNDNPADKAIVDDVAAVLDAYCGGYHVDFLRCAGEGLVASAGSPGHCDCTGIEVFKTTFTTYGTNNSSQSFGICE